MANGFIYVASPYTHPDPRVVQARYDVAMAYTAHLLYNKKLVFSPIVHNHSAALFARIPGHFGFWEKFNFAFLDKAASLIVLDLPGWKESVGVANEISYAKGRGILVKHHSLEDIRDAVLRYDGAQSAMKLLLDERQQKFVSLARRRDMASAESAVETAAKEIADELDKMGS